MPRRLLEATQRHEWVPPVAIALVGIALVWWVSEGQVASGTDPVTYVDGAHSLGSGEGYRTWMEHPITTFPPGWSLIIGAFTAMGFSPNAAGAIALTVAIPCAVGAVWMLICAVLSHMTARIATASAVFLSSVILPWSFSASSEVPFLAVTAIALVLALRWADGRTPWWVVALVASYAPLVRWAGVAVPLAIGLWWLQRNRTWSGLLETLRFGVLSAIPLGVVVWLNQSGGTNAFGSRPSSSASPIDSVRLALGALGRVAVWTNDQLPELIALVCALVGLALFAWSLRAHAVEATPESISATRLIGTVAAVQTLVLIGARSATTIDLDGRMIAPVSVFFIISIAITLSRFAQNHESLAPLIRFGVGCWLVIAVALLGRGVYRGHNSNGFYGPDYVEAFASSALDRVPQACRVTPVETVLDSQSGTCGVIANDPWSWYPSEFRPLMSPRYPADGIDDISLMRDHIRRGNRVYLLWTTIQDRFAYVQSLEDLKGEFHLEPMGSGPHLEVFEVQPR